MKKHNIIDNWLTDNGSKEIELLAKRNIAIANKGIKGMRIYKFEYETGEIDWIFAPNKKEAKEFYINKTGCADLKGCKVSLVKKSEYKNNFILDINEHQPDYDELDENGFYENGLTEDDYCNGFKIEMTFEQYAKENKFTEIFCTTEF